jgi:uncharacterized protein (DUF1697 family)
MKYVALLRGINVGGNNIIKMTDLKSVVQKCGFTNVTTYIQSGNILFEADTQNRKEIIETLESCLEKNFSYNARVVLKNYEQLKKVVDEAPPDWNKRTDLRCYVAFINERVPVMEVLGEVELREGVDSIKTGVHILYMSTLLSGLTRSRFTKLINKKTYKEITIRNYNTVLKLFELMGNLNSHN